jgi:hypothetical protein
VATKTKSERLFSRLMNARDNQLEKIVDKMLELAGEGDIAMVKSIADRVFPVKSGRPIKLDLAGLNATDSVERVVRAMDDGDLTPTEARDVLEIIKTRAELAESADIARRIEALEQAESRPTNDT